MLNGILQCRCREKSSHHTVTQKLSFAHVIRLSCHTNYFAVGSAPALICAVRLLPPCPSMCGLLWGCCRSRRGAQGQRGDLPEDEVLERRRDRGGAPSLRTYLLLTPALLLRQLVLTNINRQLRSNYDSCLVLAECCTCKLVV
jgi:hypothetical protein